MSKQPKIIVITGAESTGKSTLAKALAKHCNIPFIPEYARNYIKNLNRAYNYEDIELIAQRQVEQLNSALKLNHDIIILDTWLFITKIWFEVLYQTYPGWLDEKIETTKIDLFLVCDTDLPWIDDPVRENGGAERNKLQKKYIREIRNHGYPYRIISGEGIARVQKAINYITNLK